VHNTSRTENVAAVSARMIRVHGGAQSLLSYGPTQKRESVDCQAGVRNNAGNEMNPVKSEHAQPDSLRQCCQGTLDSNASTTAVAKRATITPSVALRPR
jgi:hypothetical protein